MKSVIDVRKFAVEKAVEVMGAGAMIKDVVTRASEIESYITAGIELPPVYNETLALGDVFAKGMNSVIGAKNAIQE